MEWETRQRRRCIADFDEMRRVREGLKQANESETQMEPGEDDIFIRNTGPLGSQYSIFCEGEHLATFSDWDEVEKFTKRWMKENRYWPNVWYIDDHGGIEIVNIASSRKIKKKAQKKADDGDDLLEKYRNRLKQLDKEIIRDWIGKIDVKAVNEALDVAEIQTDEGEEVYGGWDDESQGKYYKSVFLGDRIYIDFKDEYKHLVDDFEDELDEDQRDALSEALMDADWDSKAFDEVINGWSEALEESNPEYYQFVVENYDGIFAIRILTDKQYAEETEGTGGGENS